MKKKNSNLRITEPERTIEKGQWWGRPSGNPTRQTWGYSFGHAGKAKVELKLKKRVENRHLRAKNVNYVKKNINQMIT